MQDKINKILEQTNASLINTVIFCIGAAFTLVSFFITNAESKNVLIGIGCSLIASTVVSYLTSKYLVRISKAKQIIEFWGLSAIYETRQEMNQSTNIAFKSLEKNLDIIAWGLKSFRDSQDKVIKDKVKHGLKIRFLTLHPESVYVRQREIDEKEVEGQIKKTIEDLGGWVETLRKIAPDPSNIEARFYDSLPENFYFRVDDHIFMGPYQWGKSSQQTISYEFKGRASNGFIHYNDYFERLWSSSDFCSLS